MTPIKPLVMIKRSLEKAFMRKSQFMIMIHSEWCHLLFTCLLWDEPAIYFGVRKWGRVSKNRKTKSCTRKEKKLVHKEAWENLSTFMQVSPISGICITGMLERKSISESYSNEKC